MAYVNSGIEMKNTHYNWKMILLIALFLCVVALLAILKLLNPAMDPSALFSAKSAMPSPSQAVMPVSKSAMNTLVSKPKPVDTSSTIPSSTVEPSTTAAHVDSAIVHPALPSPVAQPTHVDLTSSAKRIPPMPSKTESPHEIACSAEDRDAQLCQ
jgi:hypothetical protein